MEKLKLCQTNNKLKNYTKQLFIKLKNENTLIFLDKIFGVDLADMQLLSKFNKGFRFLLCVIRVFSKYIWVAPLKGKTGITIADTVQKNLNESGPKPNKTWVDKGSGYNNKLFKSQLQSGNIKMYSPHNDWKSFVAERFIRGLKNKTYKYTTSIIKTVFIDKVRDIVKNIKIRIIERF